MIGAALELASWAGPKIVGALTGSDKAEETAKKVVDTAKEVTGQDDPQTAVEQIKNNPEQARKFQEKMAQVELELEREETEQLKTINRSLQMAYKESGWKTGWRPFFGYCFAASWVILVFWILGILTYAVTISLDKAIEFATKLPTIIAAFTPLFGMGLKVLGVQIRERSRDKRLAAGAVDEPQSKGFMEQVKGLFGREDKKEQ